MSKHARVWAFVAILLAFLMVAPSAARAAAAPPGSCAFVVGRLVSIEGSVRVASSDLAPLHDARLDESVCPGYVIEVGERSRAALQLANETTIRLDQRSRLILTGFAPEESSGLGLTRGALHVITRTRQRFQVTTPFINANVNGTEFTVTVGANDATVALQEGVVCTSNGRGSARIDGATATVETYADSSCSSAQKDRVAALAVTATAAEAPRPRPDIVVAPIDHVKWALHYPAVFDYPAAQRDAAALARPEAAPERLNDPAQLTRYAGMLLSVGRVDDAERFIARAVEIDPRSSDAHALRAVVAVVRNDRNTAVEEGEAAVQSDPASPAAWIALSYAQQSVFKVDEALRTMEEARSKVKPTALFLARLAELYMSVGEVQNATRTAEEARALDPGLAKTQTVSGFASLVSIDTARARTAFAEAIRLDPSDPVARLGLGLTEIRDGHLAEGRAELEIAAVLDPANSLVRSYLGKAYYEEKRVSLAGTQFELAKKLDAADPTPWFYDAILEESRNRPVEALRDLQESIDRNDNRSVYRSKLLLDRDLAARTVDVARIYQDLGFNRLALARGYDALAADPGEAAAHLFLADAYASVPRHDIARVSEALQARLRQPVTLPAMDLQLNSDNLLILRDTGPSRLGTNEFNSLFNRNQVAVQLDALGANRDTYGDQFVLGVVHDNVSFAASQLHYQTEGFTDNGSARKDIYDLFAQADLSPRASLQLEIKRSDLRTGENFDPFDPDFAFGVTIHQRSDVARIGGRFDADASADTIWTMMYEDLTRTNEALPDPILITRESAKTYAFEAQHLRRYADTTWIAGVGYGRTDDEFNRGDNIVSEGGNVYLYGHWTPAGAHVRLEGGLAAEFSKVDYSSEFAFDVSRHKLSPKLGITWTPTADTTVRAAALQTVKRPLIASQTLEPTHVAGCNQFFSGFDNFYGDFPATVSRRACIGVDQRLSRTTYVGGDVSKRKLKVWGPASGLDYDWTERGAHAYAYTALDGRAVPWLGTAQVGLSAEYEHERIERPQALTGPEGIIEVTTDRVPLGARIYVSETLSGGVSTTYVRQRGTFSIDVGFTEFDKNDRAWLTDVFVDYRLPRRMGFITLGARNLFDQSIDVFEVDPFNPQIPTRRFVYAKVRLLF